MAVAETLGDGDCVAVPLAVAVLEAVAVLGGSGVLDAVGVLDEVVVADCVALDVAVADAVGEAECVAVRLAVGVLGWIGSGVSVGAGGATCTTSLSLHALNVRPNNAKTSAKRTAARGIIRVSPRGCLQLSPGGGIPRTGLTDQPSPGGSYVSRLDLSMKIA